MNGDELRRRILDRRYEDTVRRLDSGPTAPDELGSVSAGLLTSILGNRGRIRARLESGAWRAAAAGDMARRTERFLNLRAQYAVLLPGERRDLVALYARLVDELRAVMGEGDEVGDDVGPALAATTTHHLARLMALIESTGDAEELTAAARGERTSICATYRPELQLAVLGVTPGALPEPVLDVGAGAGGALVAYLRHWGVEATGIDRLAGDDADPDADPGADPDTGPDTGPDADMAPDLDAAPDPGAAPDPNLDVSPHLIEADWFSYPVGRGRWGAILSHMSFSNHFLHHHRRGDDVALRYAARYVELLGALAVGGRFHYAPALPFIEPLLTPNALAVRHTPIPGAPAHDAALAQATTITRLR